MRRIAGRARRRRPTNTAIGEPPRRLRPASKAPRESAGDDNAGRGSPAGRFRARHRRLPGFGHDPRHGRRQDARNRRSLPRPSGLASTAPESSTPQSTPPAWKTHGCAMPNKGALPNKWAMPNRMAAESRASQERSIRREAKQSPSVGCYKAAVAWSRKKWKSRSRRTLATIHAYLLFATSEVRSFVAKLLTNVAC